jgi:SAM-dependent methyltransferase
VLLSDQIRSLLIGLRRRETVLLLVSASVLSYQVILVRSFSIGQWHHFAYMVISIALLGFGASGTLLAAWDRAPKNAGTVSELRASRSAWFAFSTTLFAIALPISFWLTQRVPFEPFLIMWDRRQLLYLGCFYLVLFVPFLAAAGAIGLALTSESEKCPRLYAFNLIGSGAGALLAVGLLSVAPVEWAFLGVVVLTQGAAVLALLDASLWVERSRRRPLATMSIVIMAILTLTCVFRPPSVRLSQYKGLSYALNLPQARLVAERSSALARVDVVASSAIREAPGLSLVAPAEAALPPQLGLYMDAETAGPITAFDGDISKLGYFDWITAAAPYFSLQGEPRRLHVCVLGAGGGAGVLLALRHGAQQVDAVELNPNVPQLLRSEFRDFAGGLYDRPEVRFHRAEARAFVQTARGSWDIIDLTLLDSFAGSAMGLSAVGENYIYTREAFEAYLHHLRPDGVLAVTRWVRTPPRDELKIFATAVAALEQMGLDPSDRLVLIRSWATATILVKKESFTAAKLTTLRRWAEERLFDTSYFPGIAANQHNRFNVLDRDYYSEAIGFFLAQGQRREQFFSDYAFDLRPATDQRPYFFHFFRWRTLPLVLGEFRRSSIPFSELGYLILIATLLQATMLAILLIVSPLAFLPRRIVPTDSPAPKPRSRGTVQLQVLVCFFALGLGYLFVEMALIQRLVFFLADPIYAVALVLAGLLFVSGLGSAWAARQLQKGTSATRLACIAAFIVAGTSTVYAFGLHTVLMPLLAWPLPARMILALVAMIPLGAMGMPFPLALRYLGQTRDELLPWAWAVNGCASVIAGPLATLLALGAGLPAVLLGASACYLLTALILGTWQAGLFDPHLTSSTTIPASAVMPPVD